LLTISMSEALSAWNVSFIFDTARTSDRGLDCHDGFWGDRPREVGGNAAQRGEVWAAIDVWWRANGDEGDQGFGNAAGGLGGETQMSARDHLLPSWFPHRCMDGPHLSRFIGEGYPIGGSACW
jgi:hypothetical protein